MPDVLGLIHEQSTLSTGFGRASLKGIRCVELGNPFQTGACACRSHSARSANCTTWNSSSASSQTTLSTTLPETAHARTSWGRSGTTGLTGFLSPPRRIACHCMRELHLHPHGALVMAAWDLMTQMVVGRLPATTILEHQIASDAIPLFSESAPGNLVQCLRTFREAPFFGHGNFWIEVGADPLCQWASI